MRPTRVGRRPHRHPRPNARRDAAVAAAAAATLASMFLATTGASADDPCTWDSGSPWCVVESEPWTDPWYFPMPSIPGDDDPWGWPPDDPPDPGVGDTEPEPPTTTTIAPTTTTLAPQERLRRTVAPALDRLACVEALTGVPTSNWEAVATALAGLNPALTAQALRTAAASHELGLAILREVPVHTAELDQPHITVSEGTIREPSVITIDPRFLTTDTIELRNGNETISFPGDQGRLFAFTAALAFAMGHQSEAAMGRVLIACGVLVAPER